MNIINDERLLTRDEIERIVDIAFRQEIGNSFDARGAGAFCKYVNFDGKSYAILTKRGENLTLKVINNIMKIINERELPVAIAGGAFDINTKGDYMLILPQVKGFNLPSYVYTRSKNIELVSAASKMSKESIEKLTQECIYLNDNSIYIDFHGANFIYDGESNLIRMLDLKSRHSYKDIVLSKNLIKISAYDTIGNIADREFLARVKDEQGIDVSFIAAQNIMRTYLSILSSGLASEEDLDKVIKQIYGENAKIEDFERKL